MTVATLAVHLVTHVLSFLDFDDSGGASWPDVLASVFFGTVGLTGVVVCLGGAVGLLVALLRGVWSVLSRMQRVWAR